MLQLRWGEGAGDEELFAVDREGVNELDEVLFWYFSGLFEDVVATNMENNVFDEWVVSQDHLIACVASSNGYCWIVWLNKDFPDFITDIVV